MHFLRILYFFDFFISAINKLLPELVEFLENTLENETLSETTRSKREYFIKQVKELVQPPILPPRNRGLSRTAADVSLDDNELPIPPVFPRNTQRSSLPDVIEAESNSDFISRQREISRQWKEREAEAIKGNGTPYQSKRKLDPDDNEVKSFLLLVRLKKIGYLWMIHLFL